MIFCDSDAIALGALRAFHEEGISVPGDAELLSIGMLDPEAASYYVPSLSVVEMPNKEIGQQVLRLMRKKVLNNDMSSEHVKVHAKLMLREFFIIHLSSIIFCRSCKYQLLSFYLITML